MPTCPICRAPHVRKGRRGPPAAFCSVACRRRAEEECARLGRRIRRLEAQAGEQRRVLAAAGGAFADAPNYSVPHPGLSARQKLARLRNDLQAARERLGGLGGRTSTLQDGSQAVPDPPRGGEQEEQS